MARRATPRRDPKRVVGFQGEPGAYAEAAGAILAPGLPRAGHKRFEDVFRGVRDGELLYGVVPVENTYAGPVAGQAERFWRSGTYITADLWLPVRHVLAGLPQARLPNVRRVLSHPQALAQCAPYLAQHGLSADARSNTASAAREVAAEGDVTRAALCSPAAAEQYGLVILDRDVAAVPGNETRFWLLARASAAPATGPVRLSGVVRATHPGALSAALRELSTVGAVLERVLPLPDAHVLIEARAPAPPPPADGWSVYARRPAPP